jgi:putative transcriptional regulator
LFTLLPVIVMIVLLIIGEAFRRGVALREDVQDLVWVAGRGADRVICHLDALLEAQGMTLTAHADAVGISLVNLTVMRNNRARATRYSTTTAICDALGCQPGMCSASS